MNRMSIKDGRVNVNRMARKILGLPASDGRALTVEEQRDLWAVEKVFSKNTNSLKPGHSKRRTGKGMKLIEAGINRLCSDK